MTAGAGRTYGNKQVMPTGQKDIRIVRISGRLALTNKSGHVRI